MMQFLRRPKHILKIFVIAFLSFEHFTLGRKTILRQLILAVGQRLGLLHERKPLDMENGRYHPQSRRHIELLSFIEDSCISREARILDVGCGQGLLFERLSDAGYKNISGCDWIELENPGFPYEQIDLNENGLDKYADSSFDCIIASDVIEHLENPAKALLSFRRIVRPRGHIFVTIPNCWNIYEKMSFFFTGNSKRYKKERSDREHSHISMLPQNVLYNLTRRADIELKKMRSGYTFLFDRFWNGFEDPLFSYNLMYHYVRPCREIEDSAKRLSRMSA